MMLLDWISERSKRLWQLICRTDKKLEIAFYRMIVLVMLLLAPPLGLLAVLLGMVIGTLIAIFYLLKSALSHKSKPSDHGGL